MRWMTAGLCVLSLVGLLGCPETYGIGGTVDQAVEEDMEESVPKKDGTCPPAQQVKEICGARSPEECFKGCRR